LCCDAPPHGLNSCRWSLLDRLASPPVLIRVLLSCAEKAASTLEVYILLVVRSGRITVAQGFAADTAELAAWHGHEPAASDYARVWLLVFFLLRFC
jgi:hypothetical protein